jgi:PAS domain S-box-containing protein
VASQTSPLSDLFDSAPDAGSLPERRVADVLEVGRDYLDLDYGFLTRIAADTQRVVYAAGTHPLLQPGEECPLDDTYCRETITGDVGDVLAVPSVSPSGPFSDEAVETFGLGAYVGAPVRVDGDVYGTVCFAADEPRAASFTDRETLFVELLAERLGKRVEREAYESTLTRRSEQLAAEKRRFEEIARTSSDIIFRVDDAATLTYVSPAVERQLGHEPDGLEGTPFVELAAPDAVDDALALYRRVRGGAAVEGAELRLAGVDGDVSVFEVNAQPVSDQSVDDSVVQGIARNVTDRQARARELETKDRAMNEANLGIVIADGTDEDNPITYVNDGFCALTGYDRDEVLGRNCRFLQGPGSDPTTVATLGAAVDRGEPVTVDVVNYRRSGVAFWNEVGITPIENEAGDVVQYIRFQRDVTERKRRKQLLDVMNRVLRHNLRNEMTFVLGATSGSSDGPTDAEAPMARAAAERLLSLADTARDIHASAGTDRRVARLDPAALVDRACAPVAAAHEDATVVRDADGTREIAAGPGVDGAVSALVENAVVHDPAPDTTVRVAARDDGDEVVLTVTDDGPGIDEMEARTVNDCCPSALDHGSGLGLWFANWVVTRYGGSLRVARRPDEQPTGTVATVRLPAVGPDEPLDRVVRPPTILAA